MEFICTEKNINATYTSTLDSSGQEYLVIVAKATWEIPNPGGRPRPISPEPFFESDEYFSTPGDSPLKNGSEFCRFKEKCDLLFDSNANSETPVTEMEVLVKISNLEKKILVTGDRILKYDIFGKYLTTPAKFTSMPLNYGNSFGGSSDKSEKDKILHEVNKKNPTGKGWINKNHTKNTKEISLPNLESPNKRVTDPTHDYDPIGLSAIGRHWLPRINYMGTYDENWKKNIFPFMPDDFNEKFNQIAPEDQQIPYPQGGERVELTNIIKGQKNQIFYLPELNNIKTYILRKDYTTEIIDSKVDTIFFETERKIFSVTWRSSTKIRKKIQEIKMVAIGAIDENWWHQHSILQSSNGGCAGCRK